MFTKDDFVTYFSEIETAEKSMRDIYKSATEMVSDPETKELFKNLYRAEVLHANIVEVLRKFAQKKASEEK